MYNQRRAEGDVNRKVVVFLVVLWLAVALMFAVPYVRWLLTASGGSCNCMGTFASCKPIIAACRATQQAPWGP